MASDLGMGEVWFGYDHGDMVGGGGHSHGRTVDKKNRDGRGWFLFMLYVRICSYDWGGGHKETGGGEGE